MKVIIIVIIIRSGVSIIFIECGGESDFNFQNPTGAGIGLIYILKSGQIHPRARSGRKLL